MISIIESCLPVHLVSSSVSLLCWDRPLESSHCKIKHQPSESPTRIAFQDKDLTSCFLFIPGFLFKTLILSCDIIYFTFIKIHIFLHYNVVHHHVSGLHVCMYMYTSSASHQRWIWCVLFCVKNMRHKRCQAWKVNLCFLPF